MSDTNGWLERASRGEPEIIVLPNNEACAAAAAERIAGILAVAVNERGRADWATTGGSTLTLLGTNLGAASFSPSAWIGATQCTRSDWISTTSITCSAGPGASVDHASTKGLQNVRSMPTPIGGSSTSGG